jgi:hypothetical protein
MKYKYIGTEEQLLELGFRKVSTLKYVRVYNDIMVIKICRRKVECGALTHLKDWYSVQALAISDLIEKGLVEVV